MQSQDTNAAWGVAAVFAALAGWFIISADGNPIPIPPAADVSKEDIQSAPPREAMTDPPTIKLAGFQRDCMDCHQIFKSRYYPDRLYQHREVEIKHGDALRGECLVCHDKEDRNRLVLHGPETVSFENVSQLCGKCHGPVYRDWKSGMHGRTMGSWDASSGKQWRLKCTECHNPHSPAYDAIAPLPAPNTLRMGDQKAIEHHYESPLMRGAP